MPLPPSRPTLPGAPAPPGPSDPVARPRGTGLLAPLLLLAACGSEPAPPPAPAPPDHPEGTVLAVGDVPILAREVDAVADAIAAIHPEHVRAHCRRLALTNGILRGAAVRDRDGARRAPALEAARAARAAIEETGADPPGIERFEGGLQLLGLDLWWQARTLEVGRWSEPLELVGRFALVRLEAIEGEATREYDRLTISIATFPYLDLSYMEVADVARSEEDALDSAQLTIVDPAWSELVPEQWKHRMRAVGP
jgi:hypothetical protein